MTYYPHKDKLLVRDDDHRMIRLRPEDAEYAAPRLVHEKSKDYYGHYNGRHYMVLDRSPGITVWRSFRGTFPWGPIIRT